MLVHSFSISQTQNSSSTLAAGIDASVLFPFCGHVFSMCTSKFSMMSQSKSFKKRKEKKKRNGLLARTSSIPSLKTQPS